MISIWLNGKVVYIIYYWAFKYPNLNRPWLRTTVDGSIFPITGTTIIYFIFMIRPFEKATRFVHYRNSHLILSHWLKFTWVSILTILACIMYIPQSLTSHCLPVLYFCIGEESTSSSKLMEIFAWWLTYCEFLHSFTIWSKHLMTCMVKVLLMGMVHWIRFFTVISS